MTRKLQPPTVCLPPLLSVSTSNWPEPGKRLFMLWKVVSAMPICFMLLAQDMRWAVSRLVFSVTGISAINTPMMRITTSSSARLSPRFLSFPSIGHLPSISKQGGYQNPIAPHPDPLPEGEGTIWV